MQHEHTNSQAEMHSLHIGLCCVYGHQNHLSLNSEVTTISFQLQGHIHQLGWEGLQCVVGVQSGLCALGCNRELGWEAATERMLDAGTIRASEWPGPLASAQESVLWSMYNFALGTYPLFPSVRAAALRTPGISSVCC